VAHPLVPGDRVEAATVYGRHGQKMATSRTMRWSELRALNREPRLGYIALISGMAAVGHNSKPDLARRLWTKRSVRRS
jgi:hypothetical protein